MNDDNKTDSCGVKNITYNNGIQAIIIKHCYDCHSGNGASKGINLEGYNGLNWWITNDSLRIMGAISNGTMPPQGKIPNCDILKLEAWVLLKMPQ